MNKINIDLRKESPQDNVNRILALESIVKYYPIEVVEEVEPRAILSWDEVGEDGVDVPMKQIDMGFILFGLPTPELRHLMVKLNKKVLKEEIVPQDNNPLENSIPEVKLSNREKIQRDFEERQREAIKNRTLVGYDNEGQTEEIGTEIVEAKVIDLNPDLTL